MYVCTVNSVFKQENYHTFRTFTVYKYSYGLPCMSLTFHFSHFFAYI